MGGFEGRRRKVSQDSASGLVRHELPAAPGEVPVVLTPVVTGLELNQWSSDNRRVIETLLLNYGALLFRGFTVHGPAGFGKFMESNSMAWTDYREPATPRSRVVENVFTSTEYPAHRRIMLHNENSHCTTWPMKICFYCEVPPVSDGETPIADCRRVLANLPISVVEEFRRRKWQYVRRFDGHLGLPWQTVFGTHERRAVEEYCAANEMVPIWGADDLLTVTYVRDSVRRHPTTGEEVWFNHGLFFNAVSALDDGPDQLAESFSAEELPYNTYFGDGGPIPAATIDALRSAYHSAERSFPWRAGDVLLLDNMLIAHGRHRYSGKRRILVGLADEHGLRS